MKKERAVMDTLMNKLKENKKLFVIILTISLIAILLGSYAIYKNSYKTEKTANSEKVVDKLTSKNTDLSKVTKVEGRLIDKTTGKSVKGVKLVKNSGKISESGNGEITVKSENTSKSTPTTSKPSTSSSSGSTSTSKPAPKPKEKQKVWIVDKPAWTETVTKNRTETKYRPTWWIKGYNGNIRIYYDKAKWNYDCDNAEDVGSWGNGEDEAYTVQVPYTETINHPEQGHWEYR